MTSNLPIVLGSCEQLPPFCRVARWAGGVVLDGCRNSGERNVSVIVPCFNAGRLLLDAVASITRQMGEFSLLEILVVDDHSTDPVTLDVLRQLEINPLVRLLENTRKKGPAGARNTGAFSAAGNWIAFLDADDLWLPGSLAVRFDALDFFPDARFISGDFQIWNADSDKIEQNFFATRARPAAFYGPAYRSNNPVLLPRPYRETLGTALCHSCSVLVRTDLFVDTNGFEESLMYKEDHHLWYKLSRLADLVIVAASVFLYRQHASNMTKRECSPFEYENAMLDFVCNNDDLSDLREQINERYVAGFLENARWHRSRKQFGLAARASLAGLRRAPFELRCWTQLAACVAKIK